MKKLRVFLLVATGLLAGIGLVFLIVRYLDKLTELFRAFRKQAFLKLEVGPCNAEVPEHDTDESREAFYPGYDTEINSEGSFQPDTPSEE
ncbi:MAG: hypothetical protein GX193_11240 [Clostridiales bacterium]|nr:hypothetical protein [Clostridiales bacterium]